MTTKQKKPAYPEFNARSWIKQVASDHLVVIYEEYLRSLDIVLRGIKKGKKINEGALREAEALVRTMREESIRSLHVIDQNAADELEAYFKQLDAYFGPLEQQLVESEFKMSPGRGSSQSRR